MQWLYIDYAGPILGKYSLLIIIDSFSNSPEVFITEFATGAFTERIFCSLFARGGIAQVLVTDNGIHFTDTNFNNWLHDLNARHMGTQLLDIQNPTDLLRTLSKPLRLQFQQ